ncbi:MAG: FliM/FliN family flagellar motor switch protein [Fibromonadaceae bacterium]|jgi:flagellar motor switch protein FliN/FliY|nr:FliM/FliN family flagellar motor switch protein [Fibromonadaceae bacterium]
MPKEYVKSNRKSLDMEQLQDLRFPMIMVLGSSMVTVRDLLNWQRGSVLELDRVAGENVDLEINGKVMAKGEVVVMNNHLGFRLVTLLSPEERLKSL